MHVLCGVACIELQEGHLAEACACLEEGLTKMQYRWYDPRSKWVLATCLEGLAEAALNQGSSAWAVQLCACAEIIRGAQGYCCSLGREQATYDHTLAEARRHLGEKAYAAAWAEGQDSAPRQVVAEAIVTAPLEEVQARGQVNQRPPVASGLPGGLTAREIEVLGLLAQGLSNNQIAVQLVLSPYTVNSHTQSIYGKLGINSRSAATRFAVEHNLLALQTK